MATDDSIDMRSLEGSLLAGRYRLEHCLDEGNFGAVYRASHIAYGVELRGVAVKVAKRAMSDSEARRIFGDALLMASLADATPDATLRQHFVSVFDAGRCEESGPLGGRPYLVMELVKGGSLKHCLRVGPFPLKRTIEYFDQILQAMAFMHGGGGGERGPIVHRDLKPANILVSRPDNAADIVKITDFGLAIEVGSLLGWVESGGDLAYLAPESFSHNICSPQSDVYMLGLVFYEMIAGHNPFREVGRQLRGVDSQQHVELRRLHLAARQTEMFPVLQEHVELRRKPELAQVIRQALAADMNTRGFANACEFQGAWQRAKKGNGPITHESAWDKVRRWTEEADACFQLQDDDRGDKLLKQACDLNENAKEVPDSLLVGKTYLLAVERLLCKGAIEEAGRLAMNGCRRRRCRSTCLAVARYCEEQGNPVVANSLRDEANSHPDCD